MRPLCRATFPITGQHLTDAPLITVVILAWSAGKRMDWVVVGSIRQTDLQPQCFIRVPSLQMTATTSLCLADQSTSVAISQDTASTLLRAMFGSPWRFLRPPHSTKPVL